MGWSGDSLMLLRMRAVAWGVSAETVRGIDLVKEAGPEAVLMPPLSERQLGNSRRYDASPFGDPLSLARTYGSPASASRKQVSLCL